MILLIILLVLLFGGGGGYYGYSKMGYRWGPRDRWNGPAYSGDRIPRRWVALTPAYRTEIEIMLKQTKGTGRSMSSGIL
jgi:hypothetical protein